MKALIIALFFVAGCAGHTELPPTQADCEVIAQEIRDHGGHQGVCHMPMNLPTDARFVNACNALLQCQSEVQ